MSKVLSGDLIYQIFSIVEEIPKGKVATYGQIAQLLGMDRNARLIGKVLGLANLYGDYPCHRVVNHQGRLAPGWKKQKDLLLKEGILFKDNNQVNMNTCKWKTQ